MADEQQGIRSIPTEYRGVRMRSRLEARVAAKFDTLGIEWSYEPEGYDLDGVWYLPDFWLPKIRTIVEVKGNLATEGALLKPHRLSAALPSSWEADHPIVVVISEPWVRAVNDADNDGFFVLDGGRCVYDSGQSVCSHCKSSFFYDHGGVWDCRACGRAGDQGNLVMGSQCVPCKQESQHLFATTLAKSQAQQAALLWKAHPSDPKAEWCPSTNETRWIKTP